MSLFPRDSHSASLMGWWSCSGENRLDRFIRDRAGLQRQLSRPVVGSEISHRHSALQAVFLMFSVFLHCREISNATKEATVPP